MQITIDLEKIIPADVDIISTLIFVGFFGLALLIISMLARFLLGKNSSLNHAISSSLGILSIYVVSVVIYTFNPGNLTRYLSPLPFVTFAEDKLALFSFLGNDFPAICYQVLSMIVLAFLVNLIDNYIPKGTKVLGWFVYRFFSVLAAMALHYMVNRFIDTFIPGIMEGYAPMILVCILLFMLSMGFLKLILGLLLTAVNPIFGAIYAFFFSNKIGKQLSKAVLSTMIICVFFFVLEYFGYSVIPISAVALDSYIPLGVCLLLLWFIIGHVL